MSVRVEWNGQSHVWDYIEVSTLTLQGVPSARGFFGLTWILSILLSARVCLGWWGFCRSSWTSWWNTQIKVNPTQVHEQMGHPVYLQYIQPRFIISKKHRICLHSEILQYGIILWTNNKGHRRRFSNILLVVKRDDIDLGFKTQHTQIFPPKIFRSRVLLRNQQLKRILDTKSETRMASQTAVIAVSLF